MSNLTSLIDRSIYILREVHAQFDPGKTIVLWSTGKDSSAVVNLCREAFPYGKVPWKVVHMDTKVKFPEIYAFRERMVDEWDLDLDVIQSPEEPNPDEKFKCCTRMKTETLKRYIAENEIEAIVVSIRRDEHGVRGKERVMSPRYEGHWNVWTPKGGRFGTALQDSEFEGWGILASEFGTADHVRVHPILHWSEIDMWKYVKDRKLPFNPLYLSKNGMRYRSLGCMPCTKPVTSNATTLDEIIDELKTTDVAERSGRAQDKEEMGTMEKLRTLGYM